MEITMDFIKFKKSLFELNLKSVKEVLTLRNKKIKLAFNMNGCFGNIKEIFYGVGNKKITEFLYTNHFEVYCFKTDKECISYFETFKNAGIDINIYIGPEEVLIKKRIKRFSKTGKQKKDKIVEVLNPIIEDFFNMPRFDVIVMNPPWDIHLKIIEKVLTYADNVVDISPVRWLQDPLATEKKTSDYKKFENTISKRIKDIEIIDSAEIDKIFGIQYNTTVAVYHFDTKGGYDYESLMDSKSKNYRKIYKAVMKNSSACPELKLYKDSKKKNFVPVCLLSGHIDALNEGPIFSRDRYRYFVNNKCINPNRKDVNGLTPEKAKSYNLKTFDTVNVAEFDTADECANFYDYITSPFFVYMCKCHSMDGNVTPKYLPFMEDYKTKRTNDEIFDYFKVSNENKKFIYQELKRL